jgi:hypothetical protein
MCPALNPIGARHGGSTLVIPELGRWRQKDPKFKATLGYIAR